MNLLFDTHIFIWWDSEPERLPDTIRQALADPTNHLTLSVASLWEMQIKIQLGKLTPRQPLNETVAHHKQVNHLQILPVHFNHVERLSDLPSLHRDPFDRLLLAQAIEEDCTLMTVDERMMSYPGISFLSL